MRHFKPLVVVGLCLVSLSAVVVAVSTGAGAENAKLTNVKVTNVTGVWRAYDPANSQDADLDVHLEGKAGSGKITGTWEALDGGGDISPIPARFLHPALRCCKPVVASQACRQATASRSRSCSNRTAPPRQTIRHFVALGTPPGPPGPDRREGGRGTGTVRAIRCSSSTSAKAIAACRY